MTSQYAHTIEALSSNERLFTMPVDKIMADLGKHLAECLEVSRVNIWLFNDPENSIDCIGHYDARTGEFSKGDRLFMGNIPSYYKHLKSNKAIVIEDVETSPVTSEIRDGYCAEHGVTALLDVPIRMQGRLRGVLCYEHTQGPRKWKEGEIEFALSVNQVVSLALETVKRRSIQQELMEVLKEKELLMKEMHHRIKNNLSVLVSLLRMQGRDSENPEVQSILSECEGRIHSMARVHEQLYHSGNYIKVRLDEYLANLVNEFKDSIGRMGQHIEIKYELEPSSIETARAIDLGLILMEILNNAFKHAFRPGDTGNQILVTLESAGDELRLTIADNGVGFDPRSVSVKSLGISLIEDLSEQINARLEVQSQSSGTTHTLYI
ncbi:MAG: GAF domain-containing protein [Cryomorphaceae bacterium]|nr:MAG: GAF domain-containing protein [Cryomorphaceae bacterium]